MERNKQDVNYGLKFIVRSGFWIFITFIFSKIFIYIYRIIIAKNLGVEAYGLFSIAFSIFLLFGTIGTLSLDRGLLRFISYYKARNETGNIKEIIKKALIIEIIIGIILFLLLYFTSKPISIYIFHNESLIPLIKIISFSIPLYLIYTIVISYLQAIEKTVLASIINNIVNNLARIIFLLIFIYLGFGINSVGYSYVFSFIIVLIIIIIFSNIIKTLYAKEKATYNMTNELIFYSIPLLGSTILSQLQGMVDTTLIGYFKGAYDAGLYNAALPIATLLIIFPVVIYPTVIQQLAKYYSKENKEGIKILFKQIPKWMLLINLPLAALITIFPGVFINLLFGKEFLSASFSLTLLTIYNLIFSIYMVAFYSFEIIKKTKSLFIITTISLLINFLIDIILIPKLGINGAAISTLISGIFTAIISILLARKYFDFNPLSWNIAKLFIITAISLIPIFIIRKIFPMNIFLVIISGSIFGLIYLILIFKAKVYDSNDIMILKAIENKINIPITKYLRFIK